MKSVTAEEAGRDMAALITQVQQGETVLILEDGKEVARLIGTSTKAAIDARRHNYRELVKYLKAKPAPGVRFEGKFQRGWAYDD